MIQITSLPIIQSVQSNLVPFRSKTSSEDYNKYQENSYFDIVNLYHLINEFNYDLTEMSMASCVENLYKNLNKDDKDKKILELESNYQGLRYGSKRCLFTYLDNMKTEDADINLEFEQINIPTYSSTSKLYLYDRDIDVVTIPKSLDYEISKELNSTDTDFLNCIRGYSNKFYIRKVETDSPLPVYMTIDINLPDNIISTRDINMISIIPYPYGSTDIISIEYQYHGSYHLIHGFTSHTAFDKEKNYIPKAKALKFCFDKTPMTKLRIVLKQENYIEEHEKNVFYLGIKSLAVGYDVVKEKKCTFNYDIDFEDINEKITIHSITPRYNNEDILFNPNGLLDYEIYLINEDGELILLDKKFPLVFEQTKIRIVSNLYYDTMKEINPSFVRYDIDYNYENDGKLGLGNGNNNNNGNNSDEEDNTPCDCILLDLVFNGETITIGGDN